MNRQVIYHARIIRTHVHIYPVDLVRTHVDETLKEPVFIQMLFRMPMNYSQHKRLKIDDKTVYKRSENQKSHQNFSTLD